jgi:hypothetical protein
MLTTRLFQLAISGRQLRAGMRQSMPSNNIDSCAAVSDTVPSFACPAFRWRQPKLTETLGAARRTGPSPAVCNSPLNADVSAGSAHLVRIVHPFHPFSGRQLICVGERDNRSGKRLLLRVDDRTICSVPLQWTDMAAPDPEVLMGQGRALFRVADLVELARLVTRLTSEGRSENPVECKAKYAANVKQFAPQ